MPLQMLLLLVFATVVSNYRWKVGSPPGRQQGQLQVSCWVKLIVCAGIASRNYGFGSCKQVAFWCWQCCIFALLLLRIVLVALLWLTCDFLLCFVLINHRIVRIYWLWERWANLEQWHNFTTNSIVEGPVGSRTHHPARTSGVQRFLKNDKCRAVGHLH